MSAPAPISPEDQTPAAAPARAMRVHHVVLPHLLDTVRSSLIVVVVAMFILTFLVQPFRIPSESMERTLLVGDFLLVDKATFAPAGDWGWLLPYRSIRHGDILVFHFPLDPEEHVVKRTVGVPGDEVSMHHGLAAVNNRPLNEHSAVFESADEDMYRDEFPRYTTGDPSVDPEWRRQMLGLIENGHLRVPTDSYFVLGDNRNHSRDSRYWGFVPRADVVGTPLLIYFSLNEPSATDPTPATDGRLGNSEREQLFGFARWRRILRIVR